MDKNRISAKLYGVGVGSGDPELMTLKAVRIIRESDIIAVPFASEKKSVAYDIAVKAVPELAEKEIMWVSMPMVKDEEVLSGIHHAEAERIMNKLEEGKNVAFLTLGDPAVFSTYMYIHEIVKAEGYPTEIISGIASFLSVAALLNTRLVIRDEELHIIPSTYGAEKAMSYPGTKVFMKAGNKLADIKKLVEDSGRQMYFLENCGMENQRIIGDIESIPDKAGYYSIVIVFD